MDSFGTWEEILTTGGITAFLLFILFLGGVKKFWVFGWQYKEVVKEKEEWKRMALRGTNLAERNTDVLEEGAIALAEMVKNVRMKDRLDAEGDNIRRGLLEAEEGEEL